MYVILGGTGHTGKKITETLLAAGKAVTIVTRDAAKAKELADKGAKVAVGDLHDTAFLAHTFAGAQAVYSLIPPKWDMADWRTFQVEIATAITLAVYSAKVPYVVNLSSMGANLSEGAGPVSGLFYLEKMLNNIPGLNVLHLRPGYFFQNLYSTLDMIKHLGIIAQPMPADFKFTLVHTDDIAAIAAQKLLALDFKGNSVHYVASPENVSFGDITAAINKATGKAISFVPSSREDAVNGMIGAGLPATVAHGYSDLYNAILSPEYLADFDRKTNVYEGKVTLEQFVENEFKFALAG